jgi:hypothetical protein
MWLAPWVTTPGVGHFACRLNIGNISGIHEINCEAAMVRESSLAPAEIPACRSAGTSPLSISSESFR